MKSLFSKFVHARFSSSKQRGRTSKDWQDILHSLNQGDYDQVSACFSQLFEDTSASHPGDDRILLMTACLISLACARFKTEGETLRIAYEQTIQSEQELRKNLLEFTKMLLDWYAASSPVEAPAWLTVLEDSALLHPVPTPSSDAEFLQPPAEQTVQIQCHENLPAIGLPADTLPVPSEAGSIASLSTGGQDAPLPATEAQAALSAALSVFCLGKLLVYQDGQVVENFSAGKPRSIFKYLVTNKGKPVAKEILMDIFWHDASPESARRNLNWAIHNLRQVLRKNQPSIAHILFQRECYLLNPDLHIWTDVDEFYQHLRCAKTFSNSSETACAMREYQAAEILYQGDFFEEDRYEDWLLPLRQNLHDEFLSLLEKLSVFHYDQQKFDECKRLCAKMLAADPCREEAHYRLMQCYYRQGYPYLAIRQYHLCVEKLKTELGVAPSAATTALSADILSGSCQLPIISFEMPHN